MDTNIFKKYFYLSLIEHSQIFNRKKLFFHFFLYLYFIKVYSMKRKISFISLLFLLIVNVVFAQFENARVSVLTCGSGSELFESFGHTAIRVCDTTQNLDVVFNYGVFEFEDFFYLKFAQGKLNYKLDASSFEYFMHEYSFYGRYVYEQVLNLYPQEKQTFIHLIEENYKPENRYYQYDFFDDNCATRVRDIIAKSLGNRSFPSSCSTKTENSLRELFLPYTRNFLWWRLGIDIALGSVADRKASVWDCMYLPDDLKKQLDTTILTNTTTTLVKSTYILLKQTKVQHYPSLVSPDTVFWFLLFFVVLLTFAEWKTKKYFKWIDVFLFLAAGLVSFLVIYLWFISDHSATKGNWNIIWANPLFIYVLFRLQKTQFLIIYILATCLLGFLVGFWFLPQHFNTAFIPISLILLVRVLMLVYRKGNS